MGENLAIRHTCEYLRRPAADIGSLARRNPYMAGRRIAPTTALPGQCARRTPRPLPGRFRGLPVDRQNGISRVQLLGR